MADTKISALTSYTQMIATDEIPVVDITASQTKQITWANFFKSPVMITPALGTPASGVATNLTGTASSLTAGLATDTVSKTGTGSTYATSTSPVFVTPTLGVATATQVNLTANSITASANAATIPITSGRNIVTNNSAATLTVTLTTGAVNMQTCMVQILDFSAVAQTLTFVNTENSTVTVPATSNGSTTLPLSIGFVYNSQTNKWRCVASA